MSARRLSRLLAPYRVNRLTVLLSPYRVTGTRRGVAARTPAATSVAAPAAAVLTR